MEMVDTDVGEGSPATSPTFSRSQGSKGLPELQQRNLPATPPRRPINRLPSEQTEKETEEYESAHDNPANGIDTRSVSLVSFNDESGDEADRRYDDDSMSQESSQSLIPHSRTRDLESSIAESSQSIIPHSLEHRLGSLQCY